MKMFSNCSGPCYLCACSGDCLAGHGDDDFTMASKEVLLERLEKNIVGLQTIGKNEEQAVVNLHYFQIMPILKECEKMLSEIKERIENND